MLIRLHRQGRAYVIESPDGSTIKQFQHLVADDLLYLPGSGWGIRGTCLIWMARRREAGLRLLRVEPTSATPT